MKKYSDILRSCHTRQAKGVCLVVPPPPPTYGKSTPLIYRSNNLKYCLAKTPLQSFSVITTVEKSMRHGFLLFIYVKFPMKKNSFCGTSQNKV